MSDAQWAAQDEDDEGELVDGFLVEEEVPTLRHAIAVAWLLRILGNWAVPRGGIVGPDVKFLLRRGRGRKPDVALFFPRDRPPPGGGVVRHPADVFIEVVSAAPSDVRRDRILKADEYAAFGVRFYWLLDPNARLLEIFELGAQGRYERALGVAAGPAETVPGCEGLSFDLDTLWAELDRLGPDEPSDPNDV